MKIISGYLGGRHFDTPKGHRTHPMSERVRGGLFAAMGDITGLSVLDAFAGSGALSFESVSRGAAGAVAVDIDKNAHQTIAANIKTLGLDSKVKPIRANISGWSDNNPAVQFDLVFAAPPYDDLQPKVVQKIVKHVKNGGLFVLDWPGGQTPPDLDEIKIIKSKNYGDAQLVFYRKE